MLSISLRGDWDLCQVNGEMPVSAQVPGGVHTDLLAAGCIPDPFVGDNELLVQWVAEKDWKYARSFQVTREMLAEDRATLVCDGLDTLGSVEVNGLPVGTFENMFRTYRWEIKHLLHEGENYIHFIFKSVVNYAKTCEAVYPLTGSKPWSLDGGPYVRKAPCHFGWDWGPMLPTIGIWKDLRLECASTARLENIHLRQRLEQEKGLISALLEAERWSNQLLQASIKVTAPDGTVYEQTACLDRKTTTLELEVANPTLWWPNGYGEQNLYAVEVRLLSSSDTIDQRKYQIGFRTVELRQQPDAWGKSFTFIVNGVPVFAKGADWIPADSFATRISDESLEGLISSAVEANMNMLRVWGGGFYEEDRFYDLCDRYGLLVWQDFVFACNKYPDDAAFFENVRVEAVQNIRRLRHRTSLVLWCGNNEMEQAWAEWNWNHKDEPINQRLKMGYDRMFHHLLPGIVAVEDPDRRYWPSSASSGLPFSDPNGQQRGDCHYWEVWHGRQPFTAYRTQFPRFMSEFGFQSLPPLETIKSYAEPEDWNMTSYVMEHHQRSYKGNGAILTQMADTFRMPKDFPMLVYLSMVLQGEGIRYGVEHWRRHKVRVSGTLIWQLNDCWPVASWSSIDYFGRWKALHYLARRFYAPLLMSVEDHEINGQMDVWLTSDIPMPQNAALQWHMMTLSGDIVDSGAVYAELGPQESRLIFSQTFDLTTEQRRDRVFVCTMLQDGKCVAQTVTPFIAAKHLKLTDPQLQTALSVDQSHAVIQVLARKLARFVELSLEGADVVFSDNYFDVPAGETITVTCSIPAGWTEEQLRENLRCISLYDSF